MKKGFSLVEMLIVIGIIAILTGSSLAAFSTMTKRAQITKARELVLNTATALTALFQDKGYWPKSIFEGETGSFGEMKLDGVAAVSLARNKLMSLSSVKTEDSNGIASYRLSGVDRCGIVDPWAMDAIKKVSSSSSARSLKVRTGGTVDDHVLRFAVDDDGDGITEVAVNGASLKVRATACVWSCGPDGVFQPYSKAGRSDDVYSWTRGQEVR